MVSDASQHIRGLIDWAEKDRDLLASPSESLSVESLGIIGAGIMGRAIAAAGAQHGLRVVVCDVSEEILSQAASAIAAELGEDGLAGPAGKTPYAPSVRTTIDLAEAARCDLVLESIVESLPAKQRLYGQLVEHLAPRSILASNTSTIPIARLGAGIANPAQFCGIHFFHPVARRPLVEIIRGPQTGDRTIAAAIGFVKQIGRTAVVVRDGPGFVVNRLLFPYLGEALQLLRQGVDALSIERAATDFGMALSPLRQIDEIGLDTTLQSGWVLAAAFPERIVASPLLVSLVKAGRLGQKSGAGFYAYDGPGGTPIGLDPAAFDIIANWIDASPSAPSIPLGFRLALPMLLEATRILEEQRVSDLREIDLATVLGLGFPAEKGGLLWWADTLGTDRILQLLAAEASADARFRPTSTLETLAHSGGRFYGAKR